MNYQNIYHPMPVAPQRGFPGRTVFTQDEIMPNDVPMDGTPGIFLLHDSSAIIMKAWNPNGTINTIIFRPDVPKEEVQEPKIDPYDAIMQALDRIEKQTAPKPTAKTKEVAKDA